MRKLYDLHVHSKYSTHDAQQSEENSIICLCQKAESIGLSGIAFSDHLDLDIYYTGIQPLDNDGRMNDCKTASEMFPKLTVIHSVELGQQMYFQGMCSDMIKKYNYDMIISSTHVVEAQAKNITSRINFSEMSQCEARAYFEQNMRETLYTAKYCDTDVLAHITYPLRYFKRHGIEHLANICDDMDIYDEIFKAIIHRGIALEINTSGIRQGHGETFPNMLLAKRYMELGGELFTVGSDSHRPCDLGADIANTTEQLKGIGAKYTVFYKQRKPEFVKL